MHISVPLGDAKLELHDDDLDLIENMSRLRELMIEPFSTYRKINMNGYTFFICDRYVRKS